MRPEVSSLTCPTCQAGNEPGARVCIACGEALEGGPQVPVQGSLFASRFEIVSVLGRGGMGMVYKARDRSLDEMIALKVIRPDLARQSALADRFRSEIRLARRIRHPNVCSIFGDGEEKGLLYICMELVEGVDLKRLVQERGPLPREEAFEAAIQIAGGLQAIHDFGVVHRDLKTANIMRDEKGVVRLMDFGLAKRWQAEDSSGVTATGHVIGTPDYMSPEQARGEKAGPQSDIYALGVVVYELFTGDVPFKGDTPLTTLLKHLNEPPPLAGERAARLPAPLVPVLRRALAKDPQERFRSAVAMAEALRKARAPGGSEPTLVATQRAGEAAADATEEMPAPASDAGRSAPETPRTTTWPQALEARPHRGRWLLAPAAGAIAIALAAGLVFRKTTVRSLEPEAQLAPPATGSAGAVAVGRPDKAAAAKARAEEEILNVSAAPPVAPGRRPPAPTPAPGPQVRIASLLREADGALGSQRYEDAVRRYDEVLKLDPWNAPASTARARAQWAAGAARRTFAPGAMINEPRQKGKEPAGFEDVEVKGTDFLCDIGIEITPTSVRLGSDLAYKARISLMSTGKQAIKIKEVTATSKVDGKPEPSRPVSLSAREVAPNRRETIGEVAGTWIEGMKQWALEVAVTGDKGDVCRRQLNWR
jgi:serine/threonine-protein kinase